MQARGEVGQADECHLELDAFYVVSIHRAMGAAAGASPKVAKCLVA